MLTESIVFTKMPASRLVMARIGLAVFVLLCAAGAAQARDFFVRPNGGTYGAENGNDWSNAFDGFSGIAWASVNPGDTIWVAGGNYTQRLNPGKSGTSSARIFIRRARSDAQAATSAAGWSSSFDSTVHQVRQGITLNSFNYITISGATTSSGGTYGWWIDYQGATSGSGIDVPNGSTGSNILVEYFRVQGPGSVTYSADGRGIDDTPFSSANNHVFSNIAIHGWESGVYVVGTANPTFEYIDMYDIMATNWSAFHPNGIYTSGARGGIVRYSRFHRGPAGNGVGEGIFFEQQGGSTDWQIYGNVFYDLNHSGWKAIQMTSNVGNIKIFNNTFDDTGVPGVFVNAGSCGSGAEVRNNLGYLSSFSSCGSSSNNLAASTPNVFVNRAARDYRIVSTTGSGYPRNAGTALLLNGLLNLDVDGTLRGSDGAWDIGAFEYTGGGSSSLPAAPTNLRISQ